MNRINLARNHLRNISQTCVNVFFKLRKEQLRLAADFISAVPGIGNRFIKRRLQFIHMRADRKLQVLYPAFGVFCDRRYARHGRIAEFRQPCIKRRDCLLAVCSRFCGKLVIRVFFLLAYFSGKLFKQLRVPCFNIG